MFETHSIIVFIWIIFVCISNFVRANCDGATAPWVNLKSGCVEGQKLTSVLGRTYYSFQSIPYATPPLRDLRFKAPQPPPKWDGVLRADKESPACLQPIRPLEYPVTYSEDCLYINVFTPYLQHPSGKLMPVFVWIHGGKFYQGSSSMYKYGADFLLTKDVVVVTFNYRLGVFGYLNMNLNGAQGNAAMKDKVLALKWIQQEISKFGGDPNSVTISGGSSGGGDVSYLYISPMARGLFHRAISQSGAVLCAWGYLPSTYEFGLSLAQALGCPTSSPEAAVSCLRTIDSVQLAEKQMMFDGIAGLENPFLPTIETDLGEEVFLHDAPDRMLDHAVGVPYILGVNNGEGLMFVENPTKHPGQFENLERDFLSYLPAYIIDHESSEVVQQVESRIKQFYFKNANSLNDTIYEFVNYNTDRQFAYCVIKTAQDLSRRAPVYLYYFTFEGEFEQPGHGFEYYNLSGVCHGEELGYLYYRPLSVKAHNNLTAYPRELDMVVKMIDLWTNFAAFGDPTPKHLSHLNVTWEPIKNLGNNHLIIGDSLEMAKYPLLKSRVIFWDNLFRFLFTKQTSSSMTGSYIGSYLGFFLLCVLVGILITYRLKRTGYQPL